MTSVEDIEETARIVVGADEPFDEHSQEDMEADHWADPVELKQLPHDICSASGYSRASMSPSQSTGGSSCGALA